MGQALRHRLPVSLRMHWRLAALTGVGLLALVLVFGSSTVRPFVTSQLVANTVSTEDIAGEGELFDDGEHTIEVSYDEAEYADMMRVFRDEGEKQWIHADITVDGTLVEDVALRLKGNSTLASLAGDNGGPGGGGAGMPEPPEGVDLPEGVGPTGGQGGAAMGGLTQLSEDEPEKLPWLISFEEYSEGRTYQGHAEITLRPASGGSEAAVGEAIALEVTAAADQVTQDYTFTSFSVNGGAATPRLLVDNPDAQWADSTGEGVLYKSRAGGTLAYRGEDPTDYEDSFEQVNGQGSYDLQPVISLAQFIAEASDEEFAEELDDLVDVDSFASYLALQALISNADAIDGPGSNYYLWYDVQDRRFTVLSWDLNLALGSMGSMGGMGSLPGGGELPEGMPEGGPQGGGSVGGRSDSPTLKQRFLENDEFRGMYEQAYTDLRLQLVASGALTDELQSVIDRAEATGDANARSAGATALETLQSVGATAPDGSQSAALDQAGGG